MRSVAALVAELRRISDGANPTRPVEREAADALHALSAAATAVLEAWDGGGIGVDLDGDPAGAVAAIDGLRALVDGEQPIARGPRTYGPGDESDEYLDPARPA